MELKNFKEALIAHLQGETVEVMGIDGVWKPFMVIVGDTRLVHVDSLSFCAGCSFRLAPRTIRVNGVEVPAPERVAPAYGITYYIPDPTLEDYYCESAWVDGLADIRELERGLVYLTKEDAISRAKAMLLTQE